MTRHGPLVALSLFAALAMGEAGTAEAQQRYPAVIELGGLFGDETMIDEAWAPVTVTVINQSRQDLSGVVHLSGVLGDGMRREIPMDVPAGQSRRAVVTMFITSAVNATFTVDGDQVAYDASVGTRYSSAGGSVVVLGEPSRVRGALLDLAIYDMDRVDYMEVTTEVGSVSFDPSTGDPLLPEDAAAYSAVRLLIAHLPSLRLANEAQRRAIEGWIASGGRLLVFPRSPQDLSDAWLSELAGPLRYGEASAGVPALVPENVARVALECEAPQRVESFGCSARYGFGRVFVASYDGTTAGAIDSGVTRELVRAVAGSSSGVRPGLWFGRGRDELASEWDEHSFATLRGALDPNEGFRPGLLLVAIVLFLYVIFVGPLNFRWVQKKNRPALALVTTPFIAGCCVVLLLGVGYIGKGVLMRYRRVELVEVMEGSARAHSRRYSGLFSTRPGSFDLPALDEGDVGRRVGGLGDRGPVHRDRQDGLRMEDIRVGLWETTFIREDRALDLAGAIRFERDGQRLATVHNDTAWDLRGAIVVDSSGSVYPVGDVPSGGQATIVSAAVGGLETYGALGGSSGDARPVLRWMQMDPDYDHAMRGVMRLFDRSFVPEDAPVLYAHVAVDSERVGPFGPELDLRIVRVAPSLSGESLMPQSPTEAELERDRYEPMYRDPTYDDDGNRIDPPLPQIPASEIIGGPFPETVLLPQPITEPEPPVEAPPDPNVSPMLDEGSAP